MRIGLVSDVYLPRLGGIEMHVHDLAVGLKAAGHAVTVFTLTDTPAAGGDVPVVRLAGLPAATDELARRLRDFDVVHAHSSLFSPLAWRATRLSSRYGVPAVITMHSLPASGGLVVPWMLARLDHGFGTVQWTAVSEVVADELRCALPRRTIQILHNGIDPEPWRRPVRREHPLTVVSTLRFAHRKRPMALLRILRDIRQQVPVDVPVRAVVVGTGPQATAVTRAARRGGMEWVELPGRLTRYEIQQLYATADVYLAPARLESFGVAALEARCAGLAVVAMASGGVGEFVRPGLEGFLVADDRAMATVTAELLSDQARLRAIQEHNSSTDPRMTWTAVLDEHVQTYRRLTQPALSDEFLASQLMEVPTIVELDR
ncbi:glycosyltransferase family 4 protein [Kribbella sp. DT2]|uniref:glycosyltransferase family 4 protein n=1 Tax=Kribbella sp. DT2 TaxID=3393427 RepID=UPI003CF67F3D